MNSSYKNFIGTYENVYQEGYCEHVISEFENLLEHGAGRTRLQSENSKPHTKNDYSIIFNSHYLNSFTVEDRKFDVRDVFFEGLQKCYDEYVSKYSVLQECKIYGNIMKVQKTMPGGGYHIWHQEKGNREFTRRTIVFMLYLNTLEPEEGGETEFLYLKQRERPVKNTMLLWPADYTHAHRGNVVLGEKSKYIVTGWFLYDDN
jgi:hypothetical protein